MPNRKSPTPNAHTWESVVAQLLGRPRRRTAEDRFARRPSRKVLVLVGVLLAGFAFILASGADRDAYHKVLVIKPPPRVSPN